MHSLSRLGPSLFDEVFSAVQTNSRSIELPINMSETQTDYVIAAEVPGIPPEALDVSIEGPVITISGEKTTELKRTDESGKTIHSERSYGRFTRRVKLPANTDPEAAHAKTEHGVLTITVPKKEHRRKIEIKLDQT